MPSEELVVDTGTSGGAHQPAVQEPNSELTSQLATEASSTRVSSLRPSGGAPQPAVQELVGAAQLAVMPLSLTAEAMAVTISWDHFDGMQFHRVRAAPLGTSG